MPSLAKLSLRSRQSIPSRIPADAGRLILDLGVGPQQPEAERAVEKQQAFDFPRLAVAVVEERHGHIECGGDLLQTGGADAVDENRGRSFRQLPGVWRAGRYAGLGPSAGACSRR
jgi:hypothetical protein